jgi:hypothetical protein
MTDSSAPLTATLTATAAADTGGLQWTRVPATSRNGAVVRSGPPLPTTTDQKAGGSSPSERATLTSGNTASADSQARRRARAEAFWRELAEDDYRASAGMPSLEQERAVRTLVALLAEAMQERAA